MVILYTKEAFLVKACVCAGIHLFFCIAHKIEQATKKNIEQKEQSSRNLINAMNAIAMDLLNALKNK